jgi:hypothetical protein
MPLFSWRDRKKERDSEWISRMPIHLFKKPGLRNNLTGDKLKAYNRLKRDNKEKHSALQDRKTIYSAPGTSYARNYANKEYSGGGYNSGGYVHNRGMFQHRGYNGGGGFGRGSSRGGGMQRGGGRQNMFPGNCNKCSGKRIVINVKLI